jgi:hypothetical protein
MLRKTDVSKYPNLLNFREQLLVVMLHVTSAVLDQNQPHSGIKHPDTLGYKLASALFQVFGFFRFSDFQIMLILHMNEAHKLICWIGSVAQTLIVSWVKASLNVAISVELWDRLQTVLTQLTVSDDLITEWAVRTFPFGIGTVLV